MGTHCWSLPVSEYIVQVYMDTNINLRPDINQNETPPFRISMITEQDMGTSWKQEVPRWLTGVFSACAGLMRQDAVRRVTRGIPWRHPRHSWLGEWSRGWARGMPVLDPCMGRVTTDKLTTPETGQLTRRSARCVGEWQPRVLAVTVAVTVHW